jgi:hypothetical protein
MKIRKEEQYLNFIFNLNIIKSLNQVCRTRHEAGGQYVKTINIFRYVCPVGMNISLLGALRSDPRKMAQFSSAKLYPKPRRFYKLGYFHNVFSLLTENQL